MISKKRIRAATSNNAKRLKILQDEPINVQSETYAAPEPSGLLLEFVSIKAEPVDEPSSPTSHDRQSPIDHSPKRQSKNSVRKVNQSVCELCLRICPPTLVIQFSQGRGTNLADGLEKVQHTLGIQLEPRPFSVCRTCWQLVEIVATFQEGCLKARDLRPEACRDEVGNDEWFSGKTVKTMEYALQILQSNLDYFSEDSEEMQKPDDGPNENSFSDDETVVKDEVDEATDEGEALDETAESQTKLDEHRSVIEKLEITIEDDSKRSAIKVGKVKIEVPTGLTPLPVYECPFKCGRRFDSKTGLGIHVRRTEQSVDTTCKNSVPLESPHCCTVCMLFFKTRVLLKCHIDKHLGTKSLACRKGCGKMFYTGATLRVHEHDCGTQRGKWLCPHCGLSFVTATHLTRHMNGVHAREANFPCKICDKQFKTREAVARHLTFSHSTENSLSCKLCDKKYKNPDSLRVHMRLHTNEMPYGCNICGKRFRYGHAVRPHMLREHGAGQAEPDTETGGEVTGDSDGGE